MGIEENFLRVRTERDEAIEENRRLKAVVDLMKEALRLALTEARSTHCEDTIKAALAAERGLK